MLLAKRHNGLFIFFGVIYFIIIIFFLNPALSLVAAGYVSFLSPLNTNYTCCCAAADGRSQMSLGVLACLSSDCDDAVGKGCGRVAASSADTPPQSDVGTVFFPPPFYSPPQMHGGLIKRCGPARLMGLIAYYAGPYIMSNRLLLSLPVNEASHTSIGGRGKGGSSDCLEEDKMVCHSCPLPSEICLFLKTRNGTTMKFASFTERKFA